MRISLDMRVPLKFLMQLLALPGWHWIEENGLATSDYLGLCTLGQLTESLTAAFPVVSGIEHNHRFRGTVIVHEDIAQLFQGVNPLPMTPDDPAWFRRLDVNRDRMGLYLSDSWDRSDA